MELAHAESLVTLMLVIPAWIGYECGACTCRVFSDLDVGYPCMGRLRVWSLHVQSL